MKQIPVPFLSFNKIAINSQHVPSNSPLRPRIVRKKEKTVN